MQRMIQTLALAAAFLALCAGLWQGWAFVVTVKKILLSYMGVFISGALMVLAIRVAGEFGHKSADEAGSRETKRGNQT